MINLRRREILFFEFSKWGFDTRGWSPATRDKYFRIAWIADGWLRENRGTTLPYAHSKDLAAWLFSTTPDPRSRNMRRVALVNFGKFLVAREIRETNPAVSLQRLPEPRPIPKALTGEQARMVLEVAPALGPMVNAMIHTFLYAGLRLTECRMLTWSNVEDHGQEAWLRFVGKRQRERVVPIHPELRGVLKYWVTLANSPEWVWPSPFPSRRRYPVSKTWVQERVREAGNMAGIEGLHPHAFRHSAATFLLEATGGDLRTVQEFLGHSSPACTAIYAMVRPARLKEAVEKLHLQGGDDGSEL